MQPWQEVRSTNDADDDEDQSSLLPVQSLCENVDFHLAQFKLLRDLGDQYEELQRASDGAWLLSSSHLSSTFNGGYLARFPDIDAIKEAKPEKTVAPNFGPCSSMLVISVPYEIVLAGFDSGNTLLLDHSLKELHSGRFFHNQIVKLIQIDHDIFGGDLDGRIVRMRLTPDDLQPTTFFDHAHNGPITELCPGSDSNHLMLSAGGDRDILLWDLRISATDRPASVLAQSATQVTSMVWPRSNDLVFGTEGGHVVRFDMRTRKVLHNHKIFETSPSGELDTTVHRITSLSDGNLAFLSTNRIAIYRPSDARVIQTDQFGTRIRGIYDTKSNSTVYLVGAPRLFHSYTLPE